MTLILKLLAPLILMAALGLPTTATAQTCPIDRPVVLAGLDWDSARFHNAVAARLLSAGYGCETANIPGSTIPLTNGLARGDIDVMMEVWRNNLAAAWVKAVDRGQVVDIGANFPDAVQGWYVPRYVVDGPNAPAPDLKHVSDLPNYTDLFKDREEPGKGRFYNCITGWSCEIVNTRKLKAYGLDDLYTNFRPGTSEALSAAVAGAVRRKRPILFYYWEPTWLAGLHDLVKLEEPAYDQNAFSALRDPDLPLLTGVEYPVAAVAIGVNTEFEAAAPEIIAMLKAYNTTSQMVSNVLAQMRENDLSDEEAADWFLSTHPDHWADWVSEDARVRILAALAGQ
ncbi:MAG: ABC transporter substrate-binding protein [Alphaproteobacteria bacterium]|nr:ABC transporter substrate-binding protein [Alphaproteobacteria bacterium]